MGIPNQDWRCTKFFNGDWKECCVAHDYDCWLSRNEKERLKADKYLFL